jgi:signal transduction histidine kinase/DNA-binding response OmpR family regulator
LFYRLVQVDINSGNPRNTLKMQNLKISTRVYLGFGSVLLLAMLIAGVGYVGLENAEQTFATYRKLARQTNADGRVQANMLTTRIFAKNFVIDANQKNIEGVKQRAEQTLKLIRENSELGGADTGRKILLGDLENSLNRYVAKFGEVTDLQSERDQLVSGKLNVLGPKIERNLTAIMTSASEDGDAAAAYEAGRTLRSLLLGRLYANRFLIENDAKSNARAIREFRDLEFNYQRLATELEDTERLKLAEEAHDFQLQYLAAFDQVHQVIVQRNTIIKYELDRIGPDVADRIERLKLAIKDEQDIVGPAAEAALTNSLVVSVIVSVLVIILGLIAAGFIGAGITRPIARLTRSAVAMGDGDLHQDIDVSRNDEIGVLAKSLSAMRDSITDKVISLQQENAERRRAEAELENTHENLERLVEDRTAELAVARDDAEQATKVKAEFLAAMSHEIRTPMNGVIGMIDLLKQTRMTGDQQEMVETVRSSAYALLTIINDILDFSKIEAGKLDLEAVPTSICDVVEGVTEILGPNAEKNSLNLYSYVDPTIPDGLLGDAVRLRQILFNLAGNAVKFTESGHVMVRVDRLMNAQPDEVTLRFQVLDTGIGISKEAQASLFEAFSQAERSTTRRFGGTGLGLTISLRLVEIMQGKIEVESELGKGSCFSVTVTLPIATEHQLARDEFDLSGLNILLAVKDQRLKEILPKYIEHAGAQATIQSDFALVEAQVASASHTTPYDVLFMENEGFKIRTNTVRAIQGGVGAGVAGPTFVLPVNHREAEREDLENTVYAVLNPVKRSAFMRAIAAAAGLASPDVEYDDKDMPSVFFEPLGADEAEAAGQLILLAEDNLTNQKVIVRQLNSLGYTVLVEDDGELAYQALQKRDFALLLTDCHMPNLDGFGLTKKVRETEQQTSQTRIPIVAITASALTEEVQQCYDCGMDGFLPKPVEIAKLHGTLKKWIAGTPGKLVEPVLTEKPKLELVVENKVGNGPIDLSFLEETFGDEKETIVEILKDFVDPSNQCCVEVEEALSTSSFAGVGAGAHKLKSAARSVGAHEVADICAELETASTAGDWDPVKNMVPELKTKLREATDYIASM